jgi:hypothetical protein
MPEAPVYEDGKLQSRPREVRLAGDWPMFPVASQSSRPKLSAKRDLGR